MHRFRSLLSVLLILTFALGATAQAAPLIGMGDASAAMSMAGGGAHGGCLACDPAKAPAAMAACLGVCVAAPAVLPDMQRPAPAAGEAPLPALEGLGSGRSRCPDPHPPKPLLRI